MVIVIGADVRKATHTFVAVGDVGRKLGEKTVPATTVGHEAPCGGRVESSGGTRFVGEIGRRGPRHATAASASRAR